MEGPTDGYEARTDPTEASQSPPRVVSLALDGESAVDGGAGSPYHIDWLPLAETPDDDENGTKKRGNFCIFRLKIAEKEGQTDLRLSRHWRRLHRDGAVPRPEAESRSACKHDIQALFSLSLSLSLSRNC